MEPDWTRAICAGCKPGEDISEIIALATSTRSQVTLSSDLNSLKHRNHGRVVTEDRRTAWDTFLTPAGPALRLIFSKRGSVPQYTIYSCVVPFEGSAKRRNVLSIETTGD